MKKQLLILFLFLTASLPSIMAQEPASVFLTAGQSNADGRVYTNQLPDFLEDGYDYLRYANVTSSSDGTFSEYSFGTRWAFMDVVNYYVEQALQTEFYAIKCAYGGTAIDTAATYSTLPVWCADSAWISVNNAYRGNIDEGKSLTKSLTEGFGDCVDVTLSALENGYDVKAIMWHQGESDRSASGHYYKNFSDMICYMRQAIYDITGDESDLTLPFIFGTVSRNSSQYNSTVESAQKQVANDLENVYYIDMRYATLRSDGLHFDSLSTVYLGQMMYNKMVELGLVDGELLEVEELTTDDPYDSIDFDEERSWDFTQEWSDESVDSLLADDTHWPARSGWGYRYTSTFDNEELRTYSGYIFPETSGLYFKNGTTNRACVNPGNNIGFYSTGIYMTIPKVKPGQVITIVSRTGNTSSARGLTTYDDDEGNLILLQGGEQSTSKVENIWMVDPTLTGTINATFQATGGGIFIYSIDVETPETAQINIGADQMAMFSSSQACDISYWDGMIEAYIATDYADGIVYVEQIGDTIPANCGVLLIGEECSIAAPVIESYDEEIETNLFKAAVEETVVEPTETEDATEYSNYILKTVDDETKFYVLQETTNLEASAYLRIEAASGASAVEISTDAPDDSVSTGITEVKETVGDGAWYDLRGMKVSKPSKGLYIKDGQIYMFK